MWGHLSIVLLGLSAPCWPLCDLPLGLLHSDNGIALVVVVVVVQDAIQSSSSEGVNWAGEIGCQILGMSMLFQTWISICRPTTENTVRKNRFKIQIYKNHDIFIKLSHNYSWVYSILVQQSELELTLNIILFKTRTIRAWGNQLPVGDIISNGLLGPIITFQVWVEK